MRSLLKDTRDMILKDHVSRLIEFMGERDVRNLILNVPKTDDLDLVEGYLDPEELFLRIQGQLSKDSGY